MLLRSIHDLASLIQDTRRRLKWSQSRLAEAIGVSRQWISLVENGKTSVEFDLVVRTLQALGLNVYLSTSEPRQQTVQMAPQPDFVHKGASRTPLTRSGRSLGQPRPKLDD